MSHFRVVVIGAGQAGLAAGQQLAHRGLIPGTDFLILDANSGPGGAWRHRWDSLTLGAAHHIADLPGMAAPLADDHTPASVAVARYYEAYEQQFNLHVRRPVKVTSVTMPDNFHLSLSDGTELTADVVISATGTWDSPFIPYVPGIDAFQGRQLHTHDFKNATDFAGQRTLVVGGGLSAIQFLLQLEKVTDTVWTTRRPPEWRREGISPEWGRTVENRVRSHVFAGEPPRSVVASTGIPARPEYRAGVERGLLISRGMISHISPTAVTFQGSDSPAAYGWDPFPAGTEVEVDTIFWNTGFRHSLNHLAPLQLRNSRGGIDMIDEVTPLRNPRLLLAGYGSTASTVGATRAGRLAAKRAIGELQ